MFGKLKALFHHDHTSEVTVNGKGLTQIEYNAWSLRVMQRNEASIKECVVLLREIFEYSKNLHTYMTKREVEDMREQLKKIREDIRVAQETVSGETPTDETSPDTAPVQLAGAKVDAVISKIGNLIETAEAHMSELSKTAPSSAERELRDALSKSKGRTITPA